MHCSLNLRKWTRDENFHSNARHVGPGADGLLTQNLRPLLPMVHHLKIRGVEQI